MTSALNETVWQDGSTDDLVFSPEELVSYCSHFVTLEPGDVILTGTPGKVGDAPGHLRAGTQLISTIEGLGSSINELITDIVSAHP